MNVGGGGYARLKERIYGRNRHQQQQQKASLFS